MTLRNEIKAIEDFDSCTSGLCRKYRGTTLRSIRTLACKQCRTDRICAAISKTAQGMPEEVYEGKLGSLVKAAFGEGIYKELKSCQVYWQKELGK